MPASLIIIAALTCFILWFRCFLLSIALGYDLQQQVLEVRRQPLITQLWLVEAETSCGLSLKGSHMSPAVLPCLKPLGGKRLGVWNMACPILFQWPVLSTPSSFASPPITFQHEKFTVKTFPLCLYLLKGILFLIWMIGHAKASPGAREMPYHRQPCAWWCPKKKASQHYCSAPSFCHIKVSPRGEIHFL